MTKRALICEEKIVEHESFKATANSRKQVTRVWLGHTTTNITEHDQHGPTTRALSAFTLDALSCSLKCLGEFEETIAKGNGFGVGISSW